MPRQWRLIKSGPRSAAYNMALDEAIAEGVCSGPEPVTLRLYGWEGLAVTLGAFQRAGDLDLAYCEGRDIPVVRRPTGGRAILHAPQELTYAFAAPEEGEFSGGVFKSYGALSRVFERAFLMLGIRTEVTRSKKAAPGRNPLCFSSASFGEMSTGSRKVIGSAQRRWPGQGMLQQGSIPIDLDYEEMGRVFGRPTEEARASMAGLGEFVQGIGSEGVARAVRAAFEEEFGVIFHESGPSDQEHARALELVRQKYASPAWNLRR